MVAETLRVKQIFLPLSRSLLAGHFPAYGVNDCPGGVLEPGAPPPPPGCLGTADT